MSNILIFTPLIFSNKNGSMLVEIKNEEKAGIRAKYIEVETLTILLQI